MRSISLLDRAPTVEDADAASRPTSGLFLGSLARPVTRGQLLTIC